MKKPRPATALFFALATVVIPLCHSCINDVPLPREFSMEWMEISVPHYCSMNAQALAFNEGGALFSATDRYRAAILRSDDKGRTWTPKSRGLNPEYDVRALLIKGTGTIFAALSGGGVFVSRDNGENWTQVNNHLTDLDIRSMAALGDGEIFAGSAGGDIFRSSNDGSVWSQVADESIWSAVIALIVDSAGILYAGTQWEGVFISENGGGSWRSSSDGLENYTVRCLAVDHAGCVLAGTAGGGIYRSPGAGEPWVRIDRGAAGASIAAITIDDAGRIFAGTYGNGVIASLDGGESWIRADNDLRGLRIAALLCADGVLHAGTDYYGFFRSIDHGDSWNAPKAYRDMDVMCVDGFSSFAADSLGGYYLLARHAAFRSLDRGETWTRACHGLLSSYHGTGDWLCGLGVHPSGSIFAGSERGIFISTDCGNSWSAIDMLPEEPTATCDIEVNESGIIFANSNNGVMRSVDGGVSWENVYESETPSGMHLLSTGGDSCVYLGTSRGVVRSTDCGNTWRHVTDPIGIYSVDADLVGNVLAAHSSGILVSTDRGNSWVDIRSAELRDTRHVLIAPRGEIAMALNHSGELFASYDLFSNVAPVLSPNYVYGAFLAPDGCLFVAGHSVPAAGGGSVSVFRSKHPLF